MSTSIFKTREKSISQSKSQKLKNPKQLASLLHCFFLFYLFVVFLPFSNFGQKTYWHSFAFPSFCSFLFQLNDLSSSLLAEQPTDSLSCNKLRHLAFEDGGQIVVRLKENDGVPAGGSCREFSKAEQRRAGMVTNMKQWLWVFDGVSTPVSFWAMAWMMGLGWGLVVSWYGFECRSGGNEYDGISLFFFFLYNTVIKMLR